MIPSLPSVSPLDLNLFLLPGLEPELLITSKNIVYLIQVAEETVIDKVLVAMIEDIYRWKLIAVCHGYRELYICLYVIGEYCYRCPCRISLCLLYKIIVIRLCWIEQVSGKICGSSIISFRYSSSDTEV